MAAVRRAEAAQRAYQRAKTAEEKERKRLYAESRQADVELQNDDLAEQIRELEHLLIDSLKTDPYIDLDQLKTPPDLPVWDPAPSTHPNRPQPTRVTTAAQRPPPSLQQGQEEHARAVAAQEATWQQAIAAHAQREQNRKAALQTAWTDHQAVVATVEADTAARHAEINDLKAKVAAADPEAIRSYFALVLESSNYPEALSPQTRLAYVPESKQLVIEYELPTFTVIPEIAAYKFAKTTDKVTATNRPTAHRKTLYGSVIAEITLRSLRGAPTSHVVPGLATTKT